MGISLLTYWCNLEILGMFRVEEYNKNSKGGYKICRFKSLLTHTKKTVWSVNDKAAESGRVRVRFPTNKQNPNSCKYFGFPILFSPDLWAHRILPLLPVLLLATSERPSDLNYEPINNKATGNPWHILCPTVPIWSYRPVSPSYTTTTAAFNAACNLRGASTIGISYCRFRTRDL